MTDLTVTSPPEYFDGKIDNLTVNGDPNTIYTINLQNSFFSALQYQGQIYSHLSFTGTPRELTSDVDSVVLTGSSPASSRGVTITDPSGVVLFSETTNCYLIGTMIETANGPTQIEALNAGDEILTYDAGYIPVRWVGRHRVMSRWTKNAQPIRIAAGAMGDGTPHRDLYVSPWHSMLVDNRFIHACLLIGCDGITQAGHLEVVEYFHVDLGDHHIILAEGSWSESYAEQWNRLSFTNGVEWAEEARFVPLCRPQLMPEDPLLQVVRTRLGGAERKTA